MKPEPGEAGRGGLSVVDLHKAYGAKRAVAGVSFELPRGQILALLGPSGSGKSTVLGLVAGLEPPDAGEVRWAGEPLAGVPAHARGFGLMFQDFALFPHMDVYENIAFGLRMQRQAEAGVRPRVEEMLALVGLPGFERRDVSTLSGGEQQRVALARSLAPRPRLLMLDEPLGSLDRNLRERLVPDLREILNAMHQTAIYVTHDQEEAFVLADRVAVMNAGRLEGLDSPEGLYARPPTAFVARFLGLNNVLDGTARRVDGSTVVDTPVGSFPSTIPAEGRVSVLLRPDAVRLNGAGSCQLEGQVVSKSFRGSTCRAVVAVNAVPLTFDFLSSTALPEVGASVRLGFEPEAAVQVWDEIG